MHSTDTIEAPPFIFYESFESPQEPVEDTVLYSSAAAVFEEYQRTKEQDTITYTQSLFENHRLAKKSDEEYQRMENYPGDWVFLCILGLFFLLSLILKLIPGKKKDYVASLFSIKSLSTTFIGGGGKNNTRIPEFFLYVFSCSLFIYWILGYYEIQLFQYRPIVFFLLVFLAFMILVFFKYMIIRLFGVIFKTQGIIKTYIFNAENYNFLISIVLSPVLLLLFFAVPGVQQWVFLVIGVCLAFLFALRIVMGFKILLFESNFSKPYLFLYLCIIEILPILALVKYVI